jgi:hypothetical protein
MTISTKTIRDFIYVDQGRLYSFYSQLNEGVAEQVFKSVIHGEAATAAQSSPDIKSEVIESQRSKALQQTESTILYDYMYEQLEDQLSSVIVNVSDILSDKSAEEEFTSDELAYYLDTLQKALMVKVVGRVEIEDYERMDAFVARANELMTTLASFHAETDEVKAALANLEEQLKAEKDRNKKAKLGEQIKRLRDPKLHAQDMNILDDPKLIEGLRVILEVFYHKKFEISITARPLYTTFRAIIEKDWLRIRPEILRSLYGGQVESSWTMIGQITSTPSGVTNLDAFNMLPDNLPELQSVRDPLRYLFGRLKAFDAMLTESKIRFEQTVCPLAIYRELKVPIKR